MRVRKHENASENALTSLWSGREESNLDLLFTELVGELDDGTPCPRGRVNDKIGA